MDTRMKTERGQALLEFALMVTILLMLVGGVIDIGRIYYAYQVVSEAAEEGALYASLHAGDNVGITTRVQRSSDVIQKAADAGIITVEVQYSGGQCANGTNMVEVDVTYNLALHMPLTMAMFGNSIPITGKERAVVLQPACSP